MDIVRVIQISDTHFSAAEGETRHWKHVSRYIKAVAPDIVVHTGDIVKFDPSCREDHRFARSALDQLGRDWLTIAGNHDIGDGLPNNATIDPELLGFFRSNYGPDRWVRDIGSWRLIGLNDLLFDMGDEEEARQWDWLESILATDGQRQLAIFVHKPPFLLSPDEIRATSMTMSDGGARRFWELVASHSVRLVACGHRHEHRTQHIGATTIVWAPTTSAILDDRTPPLPLILPRPGLVEFLFTQSGFTHGFVPLDLIEELRTEA